LWPGGVAPAGSRPYSVFCFAASRQGAVINNGKHRPPVRRRRDPIWARVCVGFGVLLMMASGAAIVVGSLAIGKIEGAVATGNLLGDGARKDNEGRTRVEGPVNFLLAGIDARPDNDQTHEAIRADSIMVVHIPRTFDRAYIFSLPRDTLVRIPANPKTGYAGGTDRINASFAFGSQNGGGREGGMQLLAKTVKSYTGLSFNAGALVDFQGFQAVVNALGGV